MVEGVQIQKQAIKNPIPKHYQPIKESQEKEKKQKMLENEIESMLNFDTKPKFENKPKTVQFFDHPKSQHEIHMPEVSLKISTVQPDSPEANQNPVSIIKRLQNPISAAEIPEYPVASHTDSQSDAPLATPHFTYAQSEAQLPVYPSSTMSYGGYADQMNVVTGDVYRQLPNYMHTNAFEYQNQ